MVNDEHLVSVIMPVYNSEKYISEAVESVLSQTYQNWEILVIDDGSTDNTKSIVESYIAKDTRIKYISLGHNSGGPARPRNIGITNASGEYIAFLDSDDLWLPDKLEKQVMQMETQKEIGLSYVLYSILLENGTIKGIFPKIKRRFRGHIFNSLYLSPVIANSSIMVRRDVFNEIGLLDEDPRLVAAEDYDMLLRVSLKRKIDYIDSSPLLIYRIRRGATSEGLLNRWLLTNFVGKRYISYAGESLYLKKVLLSSISLVKTSLENLILSIK